VTAFPTAVLTSPAFEGHETGAHPENPGRMRAIRVELERRELLTGRPGFDFGPASRDLVLQVHDRRLLDTLDDHVAVGGGWYDPDTMVDVDSVDVAYRAAGAAVRAVDAVLDGEAPRAFVLARPPGHHATRGRAMGFCLINSIAVAAQSAINRGMERVAIIDWDVHHGNGTEAIFAARPDVLFCSVHQFGYGFYPGTGRAEDVGQGAGEGFTLNVPLPAGSDDGAYERVFADLFAPRVEAFQPELILVSAGYDAHRDDLLGGMRVTEAGFEMMTRAVLDWANRFAGDRIVAILEGGYDPAALGQSVAVTLETFDAASRAGYSGVR
jgi:acetoin utilization deacetylase AcuC-like enzyme